MPITKNLDNRIMNIASRVHQVSSRLINKEQLIICLQFLNLTATTSNPEYQQRYLRWALTAYSKAMRENSLPVDRDLKAIYRESFNADEFNSLGITFGS